MYLLSRSGGCEETTRVAQDERHVQRQFFHGNMGG
jgi:hypothetical protein